ncbi:MAG TPA: LLM class flavin-dependent oxidoreductase [Blastocatellia bacterium]|nr:LLM class flavin-dependent oxidoreductase [Blastocatellia bacterium]
MKYGFVIEGGDVRGISELAADAEAAGWDGVFIADALAIEVKPGVAFPWYDPWIVLAAIAMRTERIRIGTMITPTSRRRPWKLARETVTLDHLSGGRLTLSVGLGAAEDDGGFYKVGEAMDLRVRAEMLDESLEILTGLWSGKPFSFSGGHYRLENMTMLPQPVQSPRIPIWVVGVWPKPKSMRRALRWDGVILQKYKTMNRMNPAEVQEMKQFISEQRPQGGPFDILVGGVTPGGNRKRATKIVRPFAEAGATWWLESVFTTDIEKMRSRIRQGPPLLE